MYNVLPVTGRRAASDSDAQRAKSTDADDPVCWQTGRRSTSSRLHSPEKPTRESLTSLVSLSFPCRFVYLCSTAVAYSLYKNISELYGHRSRTYLRDEPSDTTTTKLETQGFCPRGGGFWGFSPDTVSHRTSGCVVEFRMTAALKGMPPTMNQRPNFCVTCEYNFSRKLNDCVVTYVQITLSIDGTETSSHFTHDINLVHRNNDVFLGGSYDTRLLTQYFTNSNFHGTIHKVVFILPRIQGAARKTYQHENCSFSETAWYFSTKFSTSICKGCVH